MYSCYAGWYVSVLPKTVILDEKELYPRNERRFPEGCVCYVAEYIT